MNKTEVASRSIQSSTLRCRMLIGAGAYTPIIDPCRSQHGLLSYKASLWTFVDIYLAPACPSFACFSSSLCFSKQFAIMSGRGKGKTAGKKAVSRSTKAGLQFPVGRIAR